MITDLHCYADSVLHISDLILYMKHDWAAWFYTVIKIVKPLALSVKEAFLN